MTHIIESNRLIFQPINTENISVDYLCWMNDPEVNRYMETRFTLWTMNAIEEYVQKVNEDKNNYFLAIRQKETFCHIGNVKLGPINWFHRRADISLFIGNKSFWRKGYGTETIMAISDFGFKTLNLHKICAGAYDNNYGSIKAFLKAGFEVEGTLKNHVWTKSGYVNLIQLGKING